MSVFTVIAKWMLDTGICRPWYEMALPDCCFVDYGMKMHLPPAPNCVKELSPQVWLSFLLQLLPSRLAAVFRRDGTFFSCCHLKNL